MNEPVTTELPKRPDRLSPTFAAVTLAALLGFAAHILYIFTQTPEAQPAAGGLAQKIFYFHVPSAYALYLSGAVCFVGSAAYLIRGSNLADAWAKAGAECAVVFGGMVLTSGRIASRTSRIGARFSPVLPEPSTIGATIRCSSSIAEPTVPSACCSIDFAWSTIRCSAGCAARRR